MSFVYGRRCVWKKLLVQMSRSVKFIKDDGGCSQGGHCQHNLRNAQCARQLDKAKSLVDGKETTNLLFVHARMDLNWGDDDEVVNFLKEVFWRFEVQGSRFNLRYGGGQGVVGK
jgi:hypothetical protein